MTSAIPEGYHSVTPYIIVDDAAAAIEFYKKAFGATEVMRMDMGGKIGHAEILIGDSHIMLSDEFPDMNKLSPKARGGATASLMVYLEGVDAAHQRAIDAGATETMAVDDQPWGDRMGTVTDPFGQCWTLATHIEDVSEEEIGRRMAEKFGAMA